MNREIINHLLYDIPTNVDYTDLVEELDTEDIPQDRIQGLLNILTNKSLDVHIIFRASFLLTSWGISEGFDKLTELLFNKEIEGLIPNNLSGQDDTYKHILSALISYWAVNADKGNSEVAKQKIYLPIKFIIEKANSHPFQISNLFWLVENESFNEFIPLLHNHLIVLLDNYKERYWDIHDLAKLFLEIDPNLIDTLFKDRNIKLSEYGLA